MKFTGWGHTHSLIHTKKVSNSAGPCLATRKCHEVIQSHCLDDDT